VMRLVSVHVCLYNNLYNDTYNIRIIIYPLIIGMRSFLPAQSPIRDLIAMIFHNLRCVMLLMRRGRIIHDERIVMSSLKYEIVYHDINNREATPLINNRWNQKDRIKRRNLTEFLCSEQ